MSNRGLRSTIKVPNWLANRPALRTGFLCLYAVATLFDVMLEGMKQGTAAALPGYGPATDSLPLIGRNRGFTQGPGQSNDSFDDELVGWLQTWGHAGQDLTTCRVIQAFCPGNPTVRIVNRANFWTSLFPDGTYSRVRGATIPSGAYTPFVYASTAVFNWDTLSNPSASSNVTDTWIIIENSGFPQETRTLAQINAAYGSFTNWAASGFGWGLQMPQSAKQQLLAIIKQFTPPHTNVKCVIFATNDTDFNPLSTLACNGYCETWGYFLPPATGKMPQRPASASYWHLPFSQNMLENAT